MLLFTIKTYYSHGHDCFLSQANLDLLLLFQLSYCWQPHCFGLKQLYSFLLIFHMCNYPILNCFLLYLLHRLILIQKSYYLSYCLLLAMSPPIQSQIFPHFLNFQLYYILFLSFQNAPLQQLYLLLCWHLIY